MLQSSLLIHCTLTYDQETNTIQTLLYYMSGILEKGYMSHTNKCMKLKKKIISSISEEYEVLQEVYIQS